MNVNNGGGIQGSREDLLAFSELLELEGYRLERNFPENLKSLAVYGDKSLILRDGYHGSIGGGFNNKQFILPKDKEQAYLHFTGKKLVENTPKFKVGDIVNLTGKGQDSSDTPTISLTIGYQGTGPYQIQEVRFIEKKYWYKAANLNFLYSPYGNLVGEDNMELVKSEKSANMKYKVKKWYPGCEGQEGEVIETSKDYSTPAYAEFYEVVKEDILQDLLKNCKFKVGEVLPTLLLKRGSTYSTNGQRTDVLDSNVGFQASTILEFVLINNKAYFKTSRINTSDQFYFEISILESIERKRYVNWNLSEDGNSVMIGCQKYTKEDCLSFLNTLARAGQESIIFNYNSTEVPVSYTDIMYVYTLLKDN